MVLPAEQVGKLKKKTVAELNETPHDFISDNERLYCQTFTSMKRLSNRFSSGKGLEYENTFLKLRNFYYGFPIFLLGYRDETLGYSITTCLFLL